MSIELNLIKIVFIYLNYLTRCFFTCQMFSLDNDDDDDDDDDCDDDDDEEYDDEIEDGVRQLAATARAAVAKCNIDM